MGNTSQNRPTSCPQCGKNHGDRPCLWRQYTCFKCGEVGHTARHCKEEGKPKQDNKPPQQGRVYALSQQEAVKSPNLIQGTIYIQNSLVTALFDSGATHSCVAYDCARNLDLKFNTLPYHLIISTPTSNQAITSDVCLNCDLEFGGNHTLLDLICLPLIDIDVIIGMDWLSVNNALLDYSKKTITLPNHNPSPDPQIEEFNQVNTQPGKCLKENFQGYLVFYSLQAQPEEGIERIDIVKDFPKVFPTDLNGLPPDREVEFSIDLVPGRVPYLKPHIEWHRLN